MKTITYAKPKTRPGTAKLTIAIKCKNLENFDLTLLVKYAVAEAIATPTIEVKTAIKMELSKYLPPFLEKAFSKCLKVNSIFDGYDLAKA